LLFRRLKTRGRSFSFMLIDVEMPGMNGSQIAEWIHQTPELRDTKILMMHQLGKLKDWFAFSELGVFANLIKPIREAALLEILSRILKPCHPGPEKPPPAGPRPAGRSLRILLVEDNRVNQMVIEGILEKQNHKLTIASCGKRALEILKKEIFDIILMDIQLPEMDGFEATQKVRALEKKAERHTPVIAITAHALKGDRERCLAAGMDGYLAKPVRPQDLFHVLEEWTPGEKGPGSSGTADAAVPEAGEQVPVILNWSTALGYMGGNRTLLASVFQVLLEEGHSRIERIKNAIRTGDSNAIVLESHALKADARTVGAELLAAAAYQLELAAKKPDWDEIRSFSGQYEKAFIDLENFWKNSASVPEPPGGNP